jgi:phenylpropionate dioxygenase-like ring-hydroxylating dioxygenase large terminal subunit
MDQQTQACLIGELRDLARAGRCFLDESEAANPVWKYTDPAHFEREQAAIFRRQPRIVAHASELPEPGSFLRREVAGLPLLLTRDDAGVAHVFLNVCRHRGARLVDEASGCRSRFSCPYHAWTYGNDGGLLRVPFGGEGFPALEQETMGLRRLSCTERYGWLWAIPGDGSLDLDAWLGELAGDLAWLDSGALEIKAEETSERQANWKILIEGGIEAYHFRVVHRNTIGPHFPNNLSSYRRFGDHLRSILPRAGIGDVDAEQAAADGELLRRRANVLYTFFPLSNLLVMPDHIVWISNEPLAVDRTRLRICTLAPRDSHDDGHWARNNAIAQLTLAEDGAIGESIQAGLASGANEAFRFGRFEGALTAFNDSIDRHLNMNNP